MRANLAYNVDHPYDDATTSSVFSRQMWRPLPVQSPRVADYSISGTQITSFDEALRQFPIKIIEQADSDVSRLTEMTISINKLLSLNPGWDTYGGLPASEAAARKAVNIISRLISQAARPPAIVPVSDGGVQLEWHNNNWDVEIEVHPDGNISTFVDNGTFSHTWANHQLPQDRRFIEAFEAVTSAPVE